jgi:predicted  nucleic acid-binding Zn-ribbon protein
MEGSFLSGFLTISIIVLAFATIFLAYLLSERGKEANTFRIKANKHIAEAAKFMSDAKQNRELVDLYMTEVERCKTEIAKLKHDVEAFREEAARHKEDADQFRQKAETLQTRLDALKGYEQIKDTSLWVDETTRQMRNYIEEVRRYADALIERAQQQSRAIARDKMVV